MFRKIKIPDNISDSGHAKCYVVNVKQCVKKQIKVLYQ